jgi:GNAT superfamily N-acetyltransferase
MPDVIEVRRATLDHIEHVLFAVHALIREVSGNDGYELPEGAAPACARLVRGEVPGAIYLAWMGDAPVGVMTISIQEALRNGGRYAEIQELWVTPEARSARAGAALIAAGDDFCRSEGIDMMEVGLPPPTFPNFERTSAFYEGQAFGLIGPRRRRVVAPA